MKNLLFVLSFIISSTYLYAQVEVVEVVEVEETVIESTETGYDEEIVSLEEVVYEEVVYKDMREFHYNNELKGEGSYNKNFKRTGFWKNYSPKGYITASGYYKNGIKIGEWKLFHPNGQVKAEGSYLGKLDPNKNFDYPLRMGTWYEYTESGKPYRTFYYSDEGEKTGMEWH